ncbi:response regulator transcription factor [Pontibacter beigongshangensis]|uniref:response regulator transcription factor n=1 Tax=Pontibacter beigongshangensis TaxID=2574733 RepID=UPI00165044DD|nr:response regulator [Pontibacter beigongshangensis]
MREDEQQTGKKVKASVLLVEDNFEIRDFLVDLLSPLYQVLEASDGLEGWEAATENLPDLIISDVTMPEIDGIELTQKLKSDERTSHIPIILLTARGTESHQVEGLENGADEYIAKPFNVQLLLLKVRNLLTLSTKLKEKFSRYIRLQPQNREMENPDDTFLHRLMRVLEENMQNPDFGVTELGGQMGMSRPVLFRKIKMLTGMSVLDLIRSVRLKKAEMLLRHNSLSVAEIAYEVGYNDPKYFSKLFRNLYGDNPSDYVK